MAIHNYIFLNIKKILFVLSCSFLLVIPMAAISGDLRYKAEQGDPVSAFYLGNEYEQGLWEVKKDYLEAIKWYRIAADRGYSPAKCSLGRMYADGRGVQQDYSEAARWFQNSLETDTCGALPLGVMYATGQGVEQNFPEAEKLLRLAASKGFPEAKSQLAKMYLNGNLVSNFPGETTEWLLELAKQGFPKAQYALAMQYYEGKIVIKNLEDAAKWFTKAAEQGNVDAQFKLGVAYAFGEGVSQDLTVAAQWFLKAAEQGDVVAQSNLGLLYQKGQGVPRNYDQAAKWYLRAAEQGNDMAQNGLGTFYENGHGVLQDLVQAEKWYRKAAIQGNSFAQRNLGLMYRYGNAAVQYNPIIATCWLSLAAASGHKSAEAEMSDTQSGLAPHELAIAQGLASSWKSGQDISDFKYQPPPPTPQKALKTETEMPIKKAKLQSKQANSSKSYDCRPKSASIRCSSECVNGDCEITYENGCKIRVQVSPKFNAFTNQFEYPSPGC